MKQLIPWMLGLLLSLPVSFFGQHLSKDFFPKSDQGKLVQHGFYALSYLEKHEQAQWVAYPLSAGDLRGTIGRTDDYREDPAVRSGSAELADYRGSGYDRGHLAPAGDMKRSYQAMSESFFLSNMSPQLNAFNGGVWNRLENEVRSLAQQKGLLFIMTGPVLKEKETKTIGSNRVSVPGAFYKVLYAPQQKEAIAFLVPHEASRKDLGDFIVSIDSLEKITRIDFLATLADSLEQQLEGEADPSAWYREPEIKLADLEKNEGKRIKVCTVVASTFYNVKSERKPTFLNLEKPYPNQSLTLLIDQKYRGQFPEAPEKYYLNKNVCVKGKLEFYKGRPEIRVKGPNQIEIQE
jgi:endonuclease G